MSQPTQFAAQILEASAPAYAGYAASLLLERHPEIEQQDGGSAMRRWKTQLTQQVRELAAALAAEEPRLFASRMRWRDRALRARSRRRGDLLASLQVLEEILVAELPSAARDTVTAYLAPALAVLAEPSSLEPVMIDPEVPTGRLALQYLQLVLEGDSRSALDLVATAADEGMSMRELYVEVLLAAQRQVGELWHVGELSTAEEHFVTATTERAMAVVAQRVARAPQIGKTMIATAVAGDDHGMGARVLADFFEREGWRSICLGADMPAEDLASAVVYFEADVVALSATLTTHLKEVRRSIQAVRQLEDREVKILVGGGALVDTPELWRRLGADGYASSADAAVDEAARLVGIDSPPH